MAHVLQEAKRCGVRFGTLPGDLRPDDIDPPLRAIVGRINTSGWLWTTMCCDGAHNEGRPYIGFACRAEETGRLFRLLLDALRFPCPYASAGRVGCDGCGDCGEHAITFEVWGNPWVDPSWTDVFVTCARADEGSAMLQGLASLVSTSAGRVG